MKRKLVCLLVLGYLFLLAGCGAQTQEGEATSFVEQDASALLGEYTISPNEAYVESEQDRVWYTIQVYQTDDDGILVDATSNSAFFTPTQYIVNTDTALTESDVQVTWTTLMGSETGTENDQLAVAHIRLLSDGDTISERTVNFASGATQIAAETIGEKQA